MDPVTFDFTRPDGSFKPVNAFFGPNGCGKSTGLNAISMLCKARQYINRVPGQNNLLLRKMQFNKDYDPTYFGFMKYEGQMEVRGVFADSDKELIVEIKDDEVVRNDLADRSYDNCAHIDADHPMSMKKFQVPYSRIDLFLDLAHTIYGYPCYVDKIVNSNGVEGTNKMLDGAVKTYFNNHQKIITEKVNTGLTSQEIYKMINRDTAKDPNAFYQDFVLVKGDVKVHHKSMSDGEKKIATLLRNLCDPVVMDRSDIVLIDNIEMHVYFKRHTKMLDKFRTVFPDKQFIVTSHSGTLLDHVGSSYGMDCLYDISAIKGQPLTE